MLVDKYSTYTRLGIMISSRSNRDLVWHIGNNHYAECKVRFLKRFETALCLFSDSVAQLYANFQMHPCHESKSVIAHPNPHAYHDIFNSIKSDAIIPTGIRIVPSEVIDPDYGYDLTMIYRSRKSGKVVNIPLAEGIKQLERHFGKGKFLPVMMNTDLHLLNDKIPAMHLHRVDLSKLDNLSLFQRSDLQLTIETKMSEFAA